MVRPPAGTARLPAPWRDVVGDYQGHVEFRRKFHRPTNLDVEERVCLEFDGVGGEGFVIINGQPLGPLHCTASRQSLDVTDYLVGNDELIITLGPPPPPGSAPGGLFGPVSLVIYQTGSNAAGARLEP